MIQIYNSIARQKQILKPNVAGKIGLYVCGMTVYDFCHIGHARVLVGFDTVVRHLRHLGYEVTYVRNITDIDDKIIRRANELGEGIDQLTARYIDAMHEDAALLGVLPPTIEPRATGHIEQIIDMIQRLTKSERVRQFVKHNVTKIKLRNTVLKVVVVGKVIRKIDINCSICRPRV